MLRDLPRTAPDMWERIQSRRQPATSEDSTTTAAVSVPEDTVDNEEVYAPSESHKTGFEVVIFLLIRH